MRNIIILAAALLAACGPRPQATPAPPAKQVETVTVYKEVRVPCIDAKAWAALPEPAKVASDLNGNSQHDLDVVDGSAIDLRQWGRSLKALGDPCVRPPP